MRHSFRQGRRVGQQSRRLPIVHDHRRTPNQIRYAPSPHTPPIRSRMAAAASPISSSPPREFVRRRSSGERSPPPDRLPRRAWTNGTGVPQCGHAAGRSPQPSPGGSGRQHEGQVAVAGMGSISLTSSCSARSINRSAPDIALGAAHDAYQELGSKHADRVGIGGRVTPGAGGRSTGFGAHGGAGGGGASWVVHPPEGGQPVNGCRPAASPRNPARPRGARPSRPGTAAASWRPLWRSPGSRRAPTRTPARRTS